MSEQLVPEIRFEGFEGEWEKSTLGVHSHVTTGSSDVQDADPHGAYPFFVRSQTVERSSKYLFDEEAILIPGEGRLGEIFHYFDGKFDCHQRVYKISNFDRIVGKFAYWVMQSSFKQHAMQNTVKATVDSLRQPTITGFAFSKPLTFAEQKAIGSLFTDLDASIDQHRRRHQQLKQTKASLLERMFPAPGETVPQIRFDGFDGEWARSSIDQIADRYDSQRKPVTARNRVPGNTPYYGANGVQDYVQGWTHEGVFVLVAEDGAASVTDYPVYLVSGRSWVNNHAHVLQAKPTITDNQFMVACLKHHDFSGIVSGGTRAKLNAAPLMELRVRIPESLAEQQAIGAFFAKLDALIEAEQHHVEKLQQVKAALLQKMFV